MNGKTDCGIKEELLKKYHVKAERINSALTIFDINEMYDESSDADIPLRYIQFTDGTIVCSVIKECKEYIVNYFLKYSNNLFSDDGFEYIFNIFSEYMQKYKRVPYIANDEMYKHMIYYILDNKKDIKNEKIKQNTMQFYYNTSFKNATDIYQPLSQDGIYFGTLFNDKIVSIVGTNTPLQNKIIDIGLETHIDHRQNGYALSNIAAMSDYLLKDNKVILYGCNNKNINSIKTAISSGFKAVAKEKTLWFVG